MLKEIIKERDIPALPDIKDTVERREYMKKMLAEEHPES